MTVFYFQIRLSIAGQLGPETEFNVVAETESAARARVHPELERHIGEPFFVAFVGELVHAQRIDDDSRFLARNLFHSVA